MLSREIFRMLMFPDFRSRCSRNADSRAFLPTLVARSAISSGYPRYRYGVHPFRVRPGLPPLHHAIKAAERLTSAEIRVARDAKYRAALELPAFTPRSTRLTPPHSGTNCAMRTCPRNIPKVTVGGNLRTRCSGSSASAGSSHSGAVSARQ